MADTSLEHDRVRKARVYAQAAIPEYWIVNLTEERLEIHCDAGPEGYRSRTVSDRQGTVAALAAPMASIAVSDLLP